MHEPPSPLTSRPANTSATDRTPGHLRGLIDACSRYLGLTQRASPTTPAGGEHVIGESAATLHSTDDPVYEPSIDPASAQHAYKKVRRITQFGTLGALLMAGGALGAGALPVFGNPVSGLRVLGLPGRMPLTSLAVSLVGIIVVVIAWLLLGRFTVGRFSTSRPWEAQMRFRISRRTLDRIAFLWMAPFLIAPPMFSRDIYSYLAQSEITARGIDPYAMGPEQALGATNVFAASVPNIWRNTPAPYEPLFLWMGEGITRLAGDNVIASVIAHRILALTGVALIVWAVPRLARRCGVDPVAALWLGVLNPLVIFHLVAGIHNESIMIGLMVAGLELCFAAITSIDSLRRGWLPSPAGCLLISGTILISMGTMIKVPAVLALAFVGLALARRWGARAPRLSGSPRQQVTELWANALPLLCAALLLATILIIVVIFICVGSGLGFGWTKTLGAAGAVRSWLSLPTLLGLFTGMIGVLLHIGDHTTSVLSITRPIAMIAAVVLILRMMYATLAGRLHPLGGLGVAMGGLVLLFPVVQPWYLLWAIVPLAAWATRPAFRIAAVLASVLVCVTLMPTGSNVVPFDVIQAVIVALIAVAAVLLAYFDRRMLLDWRARRLRRNRTNPPTSIDDSAHG